MTPHELAAFLATATIIDPRVEVGDLAVRTWMDLIGDLGARDAAEALKAHYRECTDRVMPAHIRDRAAAIRRGRVAQVTQAELMAGVDLDTPGQEWVRILRARTTLVADGMAVAEALARVPAPKGIEVSHG